MVPTIRQHPQQPLLYLIILLYRLSTRTLASIIAKITILTALLWSMWPRYLRLSLSSSLFYSFYYLILAIVRLPLSWIKYLVCSFLFFSYWFSVQSWWFCCCNRRVFCIVDFCIFNHLLYSLIYYKWRYNMLLEGCNLFLLVF